MAWFDKFFCFEQKKYSIWSEAIFLYFFWFNSFCQKTTSGLIGFPRDLGIEVLINTYCVRGSESRSCRLVLKTLELNSVSTKTDIYLILLITHPKICQITNSWIKNWLANHWSSSKQTSQATKRWKLKSLFMKKIVWPRLYVFLLKPFKAWTLKSFRLLFWPSFSTNN